MSEKEKPAGIVLIAIYSAVMGLASIPVGCTIGLFSGVPGVGAVYSVLGFVALGAGVLFLASAYGLWTLQRWGRQYTWWLYLIAIPLGILFIFPVLPGQEMSVGNTIFQIIGIVIDGCVVAYLNDPEIEDLFEGTGRSESFEDFVRREPH